MSLHPPSPFFIQPSPLPLPNENPTKLSPGLAALQYTDLNPLGNLFRTPGVKNIENRYSAGGGAKTHLPGAATPLGDSERVDGNMDKHQGISSDKFREQIGEQKPRVSNQAFAM